MRTPSSSDWVTKMCNLRILRNGKLETDYLWIRNGVVIDPRPRFWEAGMWHEFCADEEIDCKGLIAAPGLIDVQINGGYGMDFTADAFPRVDEFAKLVVKEGVTAFCPTLVTSAPETYKAVLPLIKKRAGSAETGATILGVHLEGPFISEFKYGAHNPKLIRPHAGGDEIIREVYGEDLSDVAIVTLAPELAGSEAMVRSLCSRGIVVSAGHSVATFAQGEESLRWGVSMVTHLFNAMAPFHHRDPGLVGLIASDLSPFCGVIADGVHSHPASLKLVSVANPKRIMLVTDAMAAMGLGKGEYKLGTLDVEITDGETPGGLLRAKIKGTDTLAGSVVTMIECVRMFRHCSGCSISQALEAGSLHPAQALGISGHKGHLNFGADADIILVDDDLQLHATYVAGKLAWEKEREKK